MVAMFMILLLQTANRATVETDSCQTQHFLTTHGENGAERGTINGPSGSAKKDR
jgi:hypothetical protein